MNMYRSKKRSLKRKSTTDKHNQLQEECGQLSNSSGRSKKSKKKVDNEDSSVVKAQKVIVDCAKETYEFTSTVLEEINRHEMYTSRLRHYVENKSIAIFGPPAQQTASILSTFEKIERYIAEHRKVMQESDDDEDERTNTMDGSESAAEKEGLGPRKFSYYF